jgi:hypothetical protein
MAMAMVTAMVTATAMVKAGCLAGQYPDCEVVAKMTLARCFPVINLENLEKAGATIRWPLQ